MGICFDCATATDGDAVCSTCGAPLAPLTAQNVNRLLAQARAAGASPVARSHPQQSVQDDMLAADRRRQRDRRARDRRRAARREAPRNVEEETPPSAESELPQPADPAIDGAAAVFLALDTQPAPSRVWPIVYENIGWLVGAVFVLAGSIYGVREAWGDLSPEGRFATLAGAFFAYHAGFLGMALFLNAKASKAARVLGGVSASLLPIVAAALANLAAADQQAGLLGAALFAAAATFTTWHIGRLFGDGAFFVIALLPPALLALLLPSVGTASPARFMLPIVGLLPLLALALRARTLEAVAFALFSAVALELFALTSAAPDMPGDLLVWRTSSGASFYWLCVWVAALAALLCLTGARTRSAWPRASLGATVAGTSLAAAAALAAWLGLETASTLLLHDTVLACVTATVATAAATIACVHTPVLRHAVAPLALLAPMLLTRALAADYRWDAALGAIALCMFVGFPGNDRALRNTQRMLVVVLAAAIVCLPNPPEGLTLVDRVLLWSLALHALGVENGVLFVASAATFAIAPHQPWLTLGFAAAAGAMHAWRQTSAYVWALTLVVWTAATLQALPVLTRGEVAVVVACLGLACAVVAALFPRLPVFANGFALATLAGVAGVTCLDVAWMLQPIASDRAAHLLSMAVVAGTLLVAFTTHSHASLALRGRAGVLAAIGIAIVLGAVTNRLGRPLPPRVVAINLSAGIAALWGIAVLTQRFGPRLGKWLSAEDEGTHYHWMFHTGVVALAVLLLVDASLLYPVTILRAARVVPAYMLLGPALACILLTRSLRFSQGWTLAVPLAAAGAALLLSDWRGPDLLPLGTQWMPNFSFDDTQTVFWLNDLLYLRPDELPRQLVAHLLIGAAAIIFTAACFERTVWGAAIALVAFATFGFSASGEIAAVLALLGSVVMAIRTRALRILVPIASAVTVHAFAQAQLVFPFWAGPAFASVGLLTAIVASRSQRTLTLGLASGASFFLWLSGICYALAQGGTPLPLAEAAGVAQGMFGLNADTKFLLSTSATLLLSGLGAGVLALALAKRDGKAAFVHQLAGAVMLGFGAWYGARGMGYYPAPTTALALSVLAAAHLPFGARAGRDVLMLGAGFVLLITAFAPPAEIGFTPLLWLGLAALLIITCISAYAAWERSSALQVYVLYTAVSGGYAWLRWATDTSLRPEVDAMAALAFAFLLIGAVVVLHKLGATFAADASRRFAMLLPLIAALLVPSWQPTTDQALLAAVAAAMYALLGWAAGSRLIGAYGMLAANAALLLLALAEGMEGVEVYLVPLGLFVGMLAQLIDVSVSARQALRFVAGLLVFTPAAFKLVMQIDQAQNEIYPLAFAAACLLAIGAGMVCHIRAYLGFGLFFLLLDLGAGLARASMRDQRLGFVVLSATGVCILGGMVLLTTRREAILRAIAWARTRLEEWE